MPQSLKDTGGIYRAYLLCTSVPLWLISFCAFSQTDTTRTINPVLIFMEKDSFSRISVITSPVPNFVLNDETLRQLAVRDVGSAMRFIPGVQLKDYGGIGGIKTVSFRSLGANHTGVMIDGIKIPNVQSGAVNLNPVEVFGISSIAFTSGQVEENNSTATAYLSGNLISVKSSLAQQSEKLNAQIYSCVNSLSIFEEGFLVKIPANEKLFFGFQGFTRFGEGDYVFQSNNQDGPVQLRRENSRLKSYKFQGAAGLSLGNSKSLFRFSYYNNEQELPGAMILYNPYNDQKLWNEDLNVSITHQHFFNRWKLNAHVFYQFAELRYYDPDYLNLKGYIDNTYLQQNACTGMMFSRVIFKNGMLQLGSDFLFSNLKSSGSYVPVRYENNSVIALKHDFGKLKLETNLTSQVVYDVVQNDDSTTDRNFFELSPFASLSWKPLEESPLHLRSFYKRTFALPTFNDLYYNLIGNTNLKPERAHLFNAGISYAHKIKKWYTEFSLDGFYNIIEDKIIAIPTKDLFNWSMQNIGRVHAYGYDAGFLLNYENKIWKFTVNGSYSYNLSLDKNDPESTTYDKQIPYTPFHNASGGVILARKDLTLSSNFIYTGFRYSLNENVWSNYLEPFTDWSFSVSKDFKIGKKFVFETTVSALNVLNKNYQVIRSFPMPGRHYQVKLKIMFQ